MDHLQIGMVAAAVVASALTLKALAASWQRARTIDAGQVSSYWVVQQRVDKHQSYYS